ncbi:ferrochelatase [Carboxydocella sp. ULO1]|uniref:ferrochelatase n=1 Tax=Carboxydocella sp. ULO1 TaxID=1926599 RepID=UPI0009AC2EF3|nr:ferrochelatase [Carboxydocella sp. ULO1]GAW29167.1 hypothetical protein ULO1_17370 [Carboxydocella sp. ULO1]
MGEQLNGVLLLGFGGPEGPEGVEAFMTRLMKGRKPPPPVITKVQARYRQIGGKSPLLEITRAQAAALEARLNQLGGSWKVAVGMSNSAPYIEEGLKELIAAGAGQVIALSISPHYSRITTGAYLAEVDRLKEQFSCPVIPAPAWYDHPLFIAALAARGREQLQGFERPEEVELIFSAHSLPVSYVSGSEADPYQEQVEVTARALAAHFPANPWTLAYQSKGGGQGEWLGPEVEEVLEQLAAKGKKDVLLIPIGFAADHIETLYDIDIEQANHARSLGLNFRRARAVNDLPLFISALAEVVTEVMKR